MPNTAKLALPYPSLTDAPNGPANIFALAAALESLLVACQPGPWTDFFPSAYHYMSTTPATISRTISYARWRKAGLKTVQVQVSMTIAGATTGGIGIGLPIAGAFRCVDCGTAGIFGTTPPSQSGIAVMSADMAKIQVTDFTAGYRDTLAGQTVRYDVTYETV